MCGGGGGGREGVYEGVCVCGVVCGEWVECVDGRVGGGVVWWVWWWWSVCGVGRWLFVVVSRGRLGRVLGVVGFAGVVGGCGDCVWFGLGWVGGWVSRVVWWVGGGCVGGGGGWGFVVEG